MKTSRHHFTLAARIAITLGAVALTSGVSFADLPADLDAPGDTPQMRGLGMGCHFGRMPNWDIDKLVPLLKQLGVQYVRDSWGWQKVETTKGTYSMPPDAQHKLDTLNAAGLKVIAVLAFGNKLYENPLDSDAFANYAGWMATTFKGKVTAWEIWNEPDNFFFLKQYGGKRDGSDDAAWVAKYSELVCKTVATIKQADPNVTVLHNIEGESWLNALKAHAADYAHVDGIDLHTYPKHMLEQGAEGKDDTHSMVAKLDNNSSAWPKQYLGHPLQCWVGECGLTMFEPPAKQAKTDFTSVSGTLQAAGEIRSTLIGLAYGVKAWCIYDFVDETADPHDVESNFGLIRDYTHNYELKPAYYAVRRMARLLGPDWKLQPGFGATLDAELVPPPEASPWLKANLAQVYWFRVGNHEVTIVWKAGKPDLANPVELGKITWPGADKGITAEAVDMVTGKSVDVKLSRDAHGATLSGVPLGWAPVAIRWVVPQSSQ